MKKEQFAPFVALDCIAELNTFKRDNQNSAFTKETLVNALRECEIPANDVFVSTLRKSPVLTQVGKDQFKFAYTQPIYWGVLDRVYKDYKIRLRTYRENAKKKKQLEALSTAPSAA